MSSPDGMAARRTESRAEDRGTFEGDLVLLRGRPMIEAIGDLSTGVQAGRPMMSRIRSAAAASLLPPLGACAALKLGVVNHAGPIAASQWHLYVIVGIVLVFVAGPVLLLTPFIAWHYRLSNTRSAFKPDWNFSWPLEGLIWVPPIGIVIGLAFVLWHYTHTLDPYRRIPSRQPALEIEAVALDWKWLFIYPDQHIATVDQLAIPVGRPVHISLTSGTVMQSMLIPQLAGQIYAMPGMTSQLNLAASRAGVFRGENTQFNGQGFQNEKFDVVALPAPDYERWLARVSASAEPLDAAAYRQLFGKSSPPRPVFYSSAPPGLFKRIIGQVQEPKP
jgi:cytochrome o ubiquinol oxidase subunit 2